MRISGLLVAILLGACAGPAPSGSPPDRVPGTSSGSSSDPLASRGPAESAAPAEEATWEQLPDAPVARLEMAVAAHDGRIWLAGGLSPLGDAVPDVEVFDPGTGEWSDGPSLPTGIHHAALVSDGERLLLIGGYLGASFNRPTDLVLTLVDGEGWVTGPLLPEPRAAGAAAWDGERFVYAGGVGPSGISLDVHVLENLEWRRLGAMSAPREHFAATSDGAGRTWLLGGRVGGLDTNVATVELVEGDGIVLTQPLGVPRGGVAAFFAPDLGACLTGGESPDRAHVEVECVGADGTITSLPDLLEPHHGHGAAVVGTTAYVLLGGPEPTLSAGSTVEALDLGTGAE